MSTAPCPCREAEPYSQTHDLERRLSLPSHAPFARIDEGTIACTRCGSFWTALPLIGGGIYGDTLWSRHPPPAPAVSADMGVEGCGSLAEEGTAPPPSPEPGEDRS